MAPSPGTTSGQDTKIPSVYLQNHENMSRDENKGTKVPARSPPRSCALAESVLICRLIVDSFQATGAVGGAEDACHLILRTEPLQVFIGNLSPDCDGKDLRDFFRDYGVCNDAWVARKPPGFGFVWLDDERDAVWERPSLPAQRPPHASTPFRHLRATAPSFLPPPPPLSS